MLSRKQIWKQVLKNTNSSNYASFALAEKKPVKSVSFEKIVHVVLINDLNDLKKHNLIQTIWYSYEDFLIFQQEFIDERTEIVE